MEFGKTREERTERLLKDAELCDAVAVVGVEQCRIPCHRAQLANVSDPLRKAFFGNFKESKSGEVVLPEVTPAAFNCITRVAANLGPNLVPENVVQTLQAAKMYMVQDLADECEDYLQNHITSENVLTVMTSCLLRGWKLSQDMEIKYWVMILTDSKKVLKSPAFLSVHGSLLLSLLQRDEFDVSEEELWSRTVEWACHVQDNSELLGSISNALPDVPSEKRCKFDNSNQNTDSFDSAGKRQILLHLAQFFRMPVMGKEFFVDKVSMYLSRPDSDTIMSFHLLQRPTGKFQTTKRQGLKPPVERMPISVTSFTSPEEAARLAQGNTIWPQVAVGNQHTLRVDTPEEAVLAKVRLEFAAENVVWPGFSVSSSLAELKGNITTTGRVQTWTAENSGLPNNYYCKEWKVAPQLGNQIAVGRYASLTKVEVMAKKTKQAYAKDVVSRLSSELLILSSGVPPDGAV